MWAFILIVNRLCFYVTEYVRIRRMADVVKKAEPEEVPLPGKKAHKEISLTPEELQPLLFPLGKSKYPKQASEVDLEIIQKAASLGMNLDWIARLMGCTYLEFEKWRTQNVKIDDAYQVGKAAGIAAVAGALMKRCLAGDTYAMMFYLKVQARWSETTETPDAEELARRLRDAMRTAEAATSGTVIENG